jgi:hypothetical protein
MQPSFFLEHSWVFITHGTILNFHKRNVYELSCIWWIMSSLGSHPINLRHQGKLDVKLLWVTFESAKQQSKKIT